MPDYVEGDTREDLLKKLADDESLEDIVERAERRQRLLRGIMKLQQMAPGRRLLDDGESDDLGY